MNILIVDDSYLMRFAISVMLKDIDDKLTLFEAETMEHCLQLLESTALDLVILEIGVSKSADVQVIDAMRQKQAGVPILVHTGLDESIYAVPLLKAGANGFLSKQAVQDELKTAVETVLHGKKYLSTHLQDILLDNAYHMDKVAPKAAKLSATELKVMQFIADGKWNKEIAVLLNVKQNTVSTYKKRIYEKLQVRDDLELVKKLSLRRLS